jgi:hypothetical protein
MINCQTTLLELFFLEYSNKYFFILYYNFRHKVKKLFALNLSRPIYVFIKLYVMPSNSYAALTFESLRLTTTKVLFIFCLDTCFQILLIYDLEVQF